MESGREQNYWPGFVDALSNVVLTLVFVLVIFVFALVMASNKVEKKLQEMTQAQQVTAAKPGEDPTELRKELAAANAELAKLRAAARVSTENKTGASDQNAFTSEINEDKRVAIEDKTHNKAIEGPVQLTRVNNGIVLSYPLSVSEMDEKSANDLGHLLEAVEKTMGPHRVVIRSVVGKETYSAARRIAYYRALGARNILLTKGGASPSAISMTIVQPPQPEDGRVEIIFEKQ